jgi:hypothetical protein
MQAQACLPVGGHGWPSAFELLVLAAGLAREKMQLAAGLPPLVSWLVQPWAVLLLPASVALLQMVASSASRTTSCPSFSRAYL